MAWLIDHMRTMPVFINVQFLTTIFINILPFQSLHAPFPYEWSVL